MEPRVVLAPGRRVVVTEFNVEFVDYQQQLPAPRQIMIKPLPISPNPFHLAVRALGVTRRSSRLAEDQQRVLAGGLYNAFLQELRGRGLELVSGEDLSASPTYAQLCKKPVVRSSPLWLLNPVGSDTGTVLHTRTVAAPGLGVLQARPRARAAADACILRETRAEVAVAVRLRVGTFREQPALEHRSVLRLTTSAGSTTLRASHSLVSDLSVIESARFRPFIGRIEPIDPAGFSSELTAMLPSFICLALREPRS